MEEVGVQFASFVVESHGWLHSSASDVLRALAFNAIGGRGLAQLAIFLGFAALLSFFLRMYYRRTR